MDLFNLLNSIKDKKKNNTNNNVASNVSQSTNMPMQTQNMQGQQINAQGQRVPPPMNTQGQTNVQPQNAGGIQNSKDTLQKKLKKVLPIIFIVIVILIILIIKKNGEEEVPELPTEPYYQRISLTDYEEDEVIQTISIYLSLLRENQIEEAFSMLHLENDIFSEGMFATVPYVKDFIDGQVPETLYDVYTDGPYCTFIFGEFRSEAYKPLTKKEEKRGVQPTYLGDYITNIYDIAIPYMIDRAGNIKVCLDESGLSNATVALKTLDKCRVYLYDKLLDPKSRDNYGFYLLTGFLDMSTLPIRIETDVETLDVILDLTVNSEEYNVDHPKGYLAYDFSHWLVSRQTKEDALEWLKGGLQVAYQSYEKQQDFLSSDLIKLFSAKANEEETKIPYTKNLEKYTPTKTLKYSDLRIVDVSLVDETALAQRELENAFLTGETLVLYVDIKYSYYRDHIDSSTGEITDRSIRSSTIENVPIYLTQDEGYWKFMELPSVFFNGL